MTFLPNSLHFNRFKESPLLVLMSCLLCLGGCKEEESTPTDSDVPPSGEMINPQNQSMGGTSTQMNGGESTSMMGGASDSPSQMEGTSVCAGYCTYLDTCGSCLFNEAGECVDQAECEQICASDVPEVAASCVSSLPECNDSAFEQCYDATLTDDDCSKTCLLLEECDQCFLDETQSECLSLAACAAVCREQTPPQIAACIGALDQCGGIDGCYGR